MTNQRADSKENIGLRLIQLRKLTGMNRRSFARKYGFSESTLRSWEKGLQTGLPSKSAEIVINAFHNECVECSLQWLMTGKGDKPSRSVNQNIKKGKIKESPEEAFETVDKEVDFFKKIHPEAQIYAVNDDSMLPNYKQQDVVAGIRHYNSDIPKLIDKVCIVELETGAKLLRLIRSSTIPHRYNLYSLNPHTRVEKPFLYDIQISSAAPIIWIRRGPKW